MLAQGHLACGDRYGKFGWHFARYSEYQDTVHIDGKIMGLCGGNTGKDELS
jgi:hypothetical protein